ncbi:MAG: enolase C-terminal domain-like protein, partial [Lutispora sp.]
YTTLKTKVGVNGKLDIQRVKAIRDAVGPNIQLRLDANQGWSPKEAVKTIRAMEDSGFDIELVEQPVKAHDIEGLRYVTQNVETPIMADEALFSPYDCFILLKERAADILNIKLMKCGGLHNAQKINAMAESCGVECMIGCMIESKVGIAAAAHFAGGKLNITRADLDAIDLIAKEPISGGVELVGNKLVLSDAAGIGIKSINYDGGAADESPK